MSWLWTALLWTVIVFAALLSAVLLLVLGILGGLAWTIFRELVWPRR